MKNSVKLFLVGVAIIIIGAFMKIQKFEFSNFVLLFGILLEIFALISYFGTKKIKS